MKVLGIETSCDETAAAVVEDGNLLLSNVIASSMDLHVKYGGVVPEIAARSHVESVIPVIEQALASAKTSWDDIDAIAVTYGAGLGGSLLIGVMTAKTLAIAKNKPLYAANHIMGHCYANFLTKTTLSGYKLPSCQPVFPILALTVSGKHSQLVLFKDHFNYEVLGRTQDDAVGEAFDKIAKILGLPYPGGPSVSKRATKGDPNAYKFPKSVMKSPYDFSFSGIKTAVLRTAQELIGKDHNFPSFEVASLLSPDQISDIAASFQKVAVETLVDKTVKAYKEFSPASVIIAGGVAANQELRLQLSSRLPIDIEYADIKLCTDNGAMIATLGCYMHELKKAQADPYSLDIKPSLSM